ncbi:hypothetical protein BgiMline_036788, partial [Biomphalaria glabrata]
NSTTWKAGKEPWLVGEFKIHKQYQASSESLFGCYVFGIDARITYMHMAGYSL